eukprot:TRINITY_DN110608_c0_g1_i1.p1 TRINITY_DN110608_c0_g1~~TRINITY_DN110608_c0_g1_i1.p1  ORF type:complete len:230 (+),score=41.34 TRINITY_DN110608_c0_g1_i1:140-829(+)
MPIEDKPGDFLDADEQYIVQLCNCVSSHPGGLTKALFSKFPHADVYSTREARGTTSGDVPGTISVHGGAASEEGQHQRGVINMFGQFCPGKPGKQTTGPVQYKTFTSSDDVVDNAAQRLLFFKAGLQLIADIPDLKSVAFPERIGCGDEGGDWSKYKDALKEFFQVVRRKEVRVALYKVATWPCTDCGKLLTSWKGEYWPKELTLDQWRATAGKKYWYCRDCLKNPVLY